MFMADLSSLERLASKRYGIGSFLNFLRKIFVAIAITVDCQK
jgi:hypothetical protein